MRVVFTAAILGAAGCGGSSGTPGAVPMTGTVTLGGTPLANASVTFIPMDGTPGFGGTGRTDAQGKYALSGSRDNSKGVPPGKYRVVVSKRVMPDGSDVSPDDRMPPIESPAKEMLPPSYSSTVSPVLTATVPDGGGTIDLPLTKDGKKPK